MSIDKLRSIVKGSTQQEGINHEQMVSNKTVDSIDKFLVNSDKIEPYQRYVRYEEFIKTLDVNSDNRDIIYDTLHQLHPESPKRSKETQAFNVIDTINSRETDRDKKDYIRDNFNSFPPEVLEEVQKLFLSLERKVINKDFEKARVGQVLEAKNILDQNTWKGLDPDKSLEAHTRSFLKLYGHGLTEKIYITNGDISFASPEGSSPGYVLPDTDNVLDNFVLWNDIAPYARKKLKPHLDKSREEAKVKEIEVAEELYANVLSLPEDVKSGVLIDYAINQENPGGALQQGMRKIVESKIKEGSITTFRDIVDAYMAEQTNIERILIERINSYGSG